MDESEYVSEVMVILGSDVPLPVNPFQFILLFVVIFACVLSLLHWMLYSPPFDEHLSA